MNRDCPARKTPFALSALLLLVLLAASVAVPVLASDDNISGAVVPTGGTSIRGTLDGVSNADDVYKVALNSGDTVSIKLTGAPGTDFDLYLYPPSAKDIWRNAEVAWSENPGTSSESIEYDVPSSGTYFIDVASWDSVGTYTLTVVSPSRVSIDADKSSLTYDQTAKISGTVSPEHTGATVILQQQSADEDNYATAATANVGTGGKFEFTVRPSERTSYRVRWAGDVDHEPATSGSVEMSVKPLLSLSASDSQLTLGDSITFSGRMRPDKEGTSVTLQRKMSSGWRELKTTALNANSGFSWSYLPKSATTYDVRLMFDGGDGLEPAMSSSVRVTVVQAPQT